MRRRLHAAVVVFATFIVAMHAPAVVGQTGGTLVVGSQHSTDSDFEAGDYDNMTILGSGDSASIAANGTPKGYPLIDQFIFGDTNDDSTYDVSDTFQATRPGDLTELTLTNNKMESNSNYGITVNWYVNGELVKENWTWTSDSPQTIDIDPTWVEAGETVRVRANTTNSDNDGVYDYATADVTATVEDQNLSASYTSQPHDVSNAEQAAINITQASNVSVDAEVRTDGGTTLGSSTITTTGNHTISLSDTSSESLETVLDVTVTGDDPQFELADESILFTNDAPSVDNSSATPRGGDVIEPPPTLSIDVSDPQFGTAQGEDLTVKWYVDGELRGETGVSSNGTASYELDSIVGGDHTWHAVVTDSYGASTTTETFSFSAPAELRVYNESAPSQLIDDNVSLRVRFFADDTEQVIEREVTDGVVDLSGLSATQRYTVTVAANETDKWTYRRVVIDSLIETSSVYLLPSSEPQAQIVFELDDPTGQFPPEETTLYVEKPISKDYDGDGTNETRYQVIAGDIFGASGDFPAVLEENARYRLRVETGDGASSRILGFYSVSGPATERLQIQRVAPDPDADEGASLRATIEDRDDGDYIAIRYRDFGNATQEVQYEVVDANGTIVVANTTRTADSFADLYPVPSEYGDDASFTVNYHIERVDEDRGGQIKLGQLGAFSDRFGLDPQILTVLSYIAILGTMGLVVINNTRVAPFAGTAVASGLVIIGTVAIPMVVLSVAGIVSILVLVGGGQ